METELLRITLRTFYNQPMHTNHGMTNCLLAYTTSTRTLYNESHYLQGMNGMGEKCRVLAFTVWGAGSKEGGCQLLHIWEG